MDATRMKRSGASHSGYTLRPLDMTMFGGSDYTPAERIMLSALYCLRKKDGACGAKISEFSARELAEKFGYSISTAYRTIRKALAGRFTRGKKIYQYIYDGDEPETGKWLYFVIHDFLRFCVFHVAGENYRLTETEIEVLELLRDYETRGWKTTRGHIAAELGIATSTVSSAMEKFGKLHLVSVDGAFNPKKWRRSVNHYDGVLYRVNEKLLGEKRAEVVKREKGKSDAAKDADARTDRDRYYAALLQARENAISAARSKLDAKYLADERASRALDLELGRAEAFGRSELIASLTEKKQSLALAMQEGLRRCGLECKDLEPPYACTDCHDSGVRADGSYCTCYLRR